MGPRVRGDDGLLPSYPITRVPLLPNAEYLLLEHEGAPIGRAFINTTQEEVRLVDLSITPEARRRGHAASVLRALQERASHAGQPVTLRVRNRQAADTSAHAAPRHPRARGDPC